MNTLRAEGYTSIRTGALSGEAAEQFEIMNFHEIQKLALLRLGTATPSKVDGPAPHHEMRALRSVRSMDIAARIDQEAFDFGWQLDALGIREACRATPTHRIRLALTSTDEPVGYMITGRNGSAGFIQRLAVSPTHAGQGVATSLLQDGLKWLSKAGVNDIGGNADGGPAAPFAVFAVDHHARHRLCATLGDAHLVIGQIHIIDHGLVGSKVFGQSFRQSIYRPPIIAQLIHRFADGHFLFAVNTHHNKCL